jgi:2-keto-4-pentenoate hydratase/2-oxohepta-3-ene-1,7-dioic acid hydratase in catechol pathway
MIQLVSYNEDGLIKTGLMLHGHVYASERYPSCQNVLDDWVNARERLVSLEAKLLTREPVKNPQLVAPLVHPKNIYFAGVNYKDHVNEMKARLGLPLESDPKSKGLQPWFSTKATGSSVVGPGAKVQRPLDTAMLDWEIELAIVMGVECKNVKASDALNFVAGFTIANDLSARDHVSRAGVANDSPFKWDWISQKSFDGSCPMGPAITPTQFIADPMNLKMSLWVNDELLQSSNTSQMIFSIQDQIEYLSSRITLMPGDVILTGTPAGVGMAKNKFLKTGDKVRQSIESIGEFSFEIVD